MENKYSKKQLEELYNCDIMRESGIDCNLKFYTAIGLSLKDDDKPLFDYADGWSLDGLHENIRDAILHQSITL